MKKLLTGITLLATMSSFANCEKALDSLINDAINVGKLVKEAELSEQKNSPVKDLKRANAEMSEERLRSVAKILTLNEC